MSFRPKNDLPSESSFKFHYSGKGSELAFIMFKNLFFSIFTLGIYVPWGRTNVRRYLWGHTHFLDDRAGYTGTGKELFMGILKAFAIYLVLSITLGVLSKFFPLFIEIGSIPVYIVLMGLVVYGALHYRISRTTWRGVHLGLDKNQELTKKFVGLWSIYFALSLITLGLGFPLMIHKVRSFLMNNMKIGESYFKYTGTAQGLYKIYGKALIFIPLTLGLYFYWFRVEGMRYRLEHTQFQNAHLKTNLKGGELFRFSVLATVLTILTLGLATPWVINMFHGLIINSIDLNGTINLEEVNNSHPQGSDGAAADGGAAVYDLDIAV